MTGSLSASKTDFEEQREEGALGQFNGAPLSLPSKPNADINAYGSGLAAYSFALTCGEKPGTIILHQIVFAPGCHVNRRYYVIIGVYYRRNGNAH